MEIKIYWWGALYQKFNIFVYQTFYSESIKILNFYDGSKFIPQIALNVPISGFLSEILFKLGLNKTEKYEKRLLFRGLTNPSCHVPSLRLPVSVSL